MRRPLTLLTLTCALSLAGCPSKQSETAQVAPDPASQRAEAVAAQAAAAEGVVEQEPTQAQTAAAVQVVGARGTVTHNDQTMTIQAGVAVWDAEESTLTVTLLPFVPSEAEIERVRKDETFFAIMDREEKLLGDRTPYAHVRLSWPFEKEEVGNLEKAYVHLYIGHLKENGSNMNLNFPATDEAQGGPLGLEGKLAVGEEVKLKVKGEGDLFDDTMSWEIEFQGPIQAAISDD